MAIQTPPPSPELASPSNNGVSWHLAWGQRLWWLISALSGTLEIEQRTKEHKLRTKQIKNETERLKNENKRLAELESKLDALFSKYGINSTPTPPTEKP